MKKIKSKDIVQLMHEEYKNKLVNQLQEVKVFDSRGNIVIGKDLKVKHEPSGFVYTVRGVDGEPGNAKIVLRAPEQPRVNSSVDNIQQTMSTKEPSMNSKKNSEVDYEQNDKFAEDSNIKNDEKEDKKNYGKNAYPKEKAPPKQDSGVTMFVIDQKEFEKYYKEA